MSKFTYYPSSHQSSGLEPKVSEKERNLDKVLMAQKTYSFYLMKGCKVTPAIFLALLERYIFYSIKCLQFLHESGDGQA